MRKLLSPVYTRGTATKLIYHFTYIMTKAILNKKSVLLEIFECLAFINEDIITYIESCARQKYN